jgi:hypothetical protein
MVVVLVVIVLLVGAVWGQQETVALHLAIAVVSSVSIGWTGGGSKDRSNCRSCGCGSKNS